MSAEELKDVKESLIEWQEASLDWERKCREALEEVERQKDIVVEMRKLNNNVITERDALRNINDALLKHSEGVTIRELKLAEALKHTFKVFHSMADRGDYPLELLETYPEHFLGKRGFQYLVDAIKAAEPEFDSFKFSQEAEKERG